MIPAVFVTDLCWAGLAFLGAWRAPTRRARRLLLALFVYILIEAAFHVPMEALAAEAMGRLS